MRREATDRSAGAYVCVTYGIVGCSAAAGKQATLQLNERPIPFDRTPGRVAPEVTLGIDGDTQAADDSGMV